MDVGKKYTVIIEDDSRASRVRKEMEFLGVDNGILTFFNKQRNKTESFPNNRIFRIEDE